MGGEGGGGVRDIFYGTASSDCILYATASYRLCECLID